MEVSTDKVDTRSRHRPGVLTKIIAHEDETVEVGGEWQSSVTPPKQTAAALG
ncbi:hypothetical protein I552_0401 [Mycobacterium xenopi 3993]|nr:hypothetical protein I552_0401 [Mycobacterium xenopi 3993]